MFPFSDLLEIYDRSKIFNSKVVHRYIYIYKNILKKTWHHSKNNFYHFVRAPHIYRFKISDVRASSIVVGFKIVFRKTVEDLANPLTIIPPSAGKHAFF